MASKPPHSTDELPGGLTRVPGLATLYAMLRAWQAEFAPRHYERAVSPVPLEALPARRVTRRRRSR